MPVQQTLFPEVQPPLWFCLRLHDATRLHYDFRIWILNTLFSIVLLDPLSSDPDCLTKVKIMADHDPNARLSERVIPADKPGGGPTMPVDDGACVPNLETYSDYPLEALHQLSRGKFRFTLEGRHLQGGWQLSHRRKDIWTLQKLVDNFAGTDPIAPTQSIKTGRTIDQLRSQWKPK